MAVLYAWLRVEVGASAWRVLRPGRWLRARAPRSGALLVRPIHGAETPILREAPQQAVAG